MPFGGVFSAIGNLFKKHSGSVLNISVGTVVLVFEILFDNFIFKCPCYIETPNEKVSPQVRWYGMVCLLVPATLLFFICISLNSSLQKRWKGCWWKSRHTGFAGSCIRIFVYSADMLICLIPSLVWICYGLLDGDYYACAVTPKPSNSTGDGASCDNFESSDAYTLNQKESQAIGWICLFAFSSFYFFAYSFRQCCSRQTYYEEMYQRNFDESEEQCFEEEIKRKTDEKAKMYVEDFIKDDREGYEWEEVAPETNASIDYYSNLERWWNKNNVNGQT